MWGFGSAVAAGGVVVKRAMISVGFKGLARSSAPIAVAQLGLEVGCDLVRAVKGEISGEESLGLIFYILTREYLKYHKKNFDGKVEDFIEE